MNKKLILTSLCAVSLSWSGWYTSEEHAQEARTRAHVHPHAAASLHISGLRQGSGVLIRDDMVVTAAHVVAPYDDTSSESWGPFKKYDGKFSLRDSSGNCLPPIKDIYYAREPDIAFMQLSESVSHKPAPIMSKPMYDEIAKSFNPLTGSNAPRFAGHFKGGLDADYLGYGQMAVHTGSVAFAGNSGGYQVGHKEIGTPQCARLQLSQYFPESNFYSWMSVDKVGPCATGLPGDSGSGTFTKDENAWLMGIVANIQTSSVCFSGRGVATQVIPIHQTVPGADDTYFETFLRIKK